MPINQLLFSFKGRINRKPFIIFFLINTLLYMILTSIFNEKPGEMLFLLITFIPSLAMQIKRFHDINKSGWWCFIFIVPIVNLFYFVVLLSRKGTESYNDFGDNPLDINRINLAKAN